MKTRLLIKSDNVPEAHLIKNQLDNAGIPCMITNENFTTLLPIYQNMLGAGIQIRVNENDYAEAREIIKDKLDPQNEELSCPYCGSQNIGLGMGKKKIHKILDIILSLLAFVPMGNLKSKYYCKDCGEEIK